jgi:hypothetical protein
MPRYFDWAQLRNAITAQALPALEQLAAHPARLDHTRATRFERDDSPPYVSSSESETEEALRHPVLARPHEAVLQEFDELLRQPLTDQECRNLVTVLDIINLYSPGARYRNEARLEDQRLTSFCGRQPYRSRIREFLEGEPGNQRRAVIVRHQHQEAMAAPRCLEPSVGDPRPG